MWLWGLGYLTGISTIPKIPCKSMEGEPNIVISYRGNIYKLVYSLMCEEDMS